MTTAPPPYMHTYMELEKKATILFSPDLYEHLTRVARERGVSVGRLVREACERQYGRWSSADGIAAVEGLAMLELPVDSPAELKRQSVPDPGELLP